MFSVVVFFTNTNQKLKDEIIGYQYSEARSPQTLLWMKHRYRLFYAKWNIDLNTGDLTKLVQKMPKKSNFPKLLTNPTMIVGFSHSLHDWEAGFFLMFFLAPRYPGQSLSAQC